MERHYAEAPVAAEHASKWARDAAFFKGCRQVLDLGCGPGHFLQALRLTGTPGYGVDLESGSLAACKGQGLTAKRGDALGHLRTLKAAAVDGIHCSNLLEHLPASQAQALLSLAASKLAPGGRLCLSTANPACLGLVAGDFWDDSQHVRFYSVRWLRREAEAADLAVVFASGDERTRPSGAARSLLRWLRTRLIGPYFGPPEILLLAHKQA